VPLTGGDGARRANLVRKIIIDGAGAGALGNAAAIEENIFVVSGICGAAGAVGLGECIATEGAPVKLCDGAAGAVVRGAGFLSHPETESVVDVMLSIAQFGCETGIHRQ